MPRIDLRAVEGRAVGPALTATSVMALAALILGLAQPDLRGGNMAYRGIGMNLVLLVDRSSSMDDTFAGRSPNGGDESKASPTRRTCGAERHLHLFLQDLGLSYRAFEADSPGAVQAAGAEIGRMESRPILTSRPVPRRDLGWACHVLASLCCAALATARWFERRYAPHMPTPPLVTR